MKRIKADRIEDVPHKPEKCRGCQHEGECGAVCRSAVRHEYDIEINIVDKQHYMESYACRKAEGRQFQASSPKG